MGAALVGDAVSYEPPANFKMEDRLNRENATLRERVTLLERGAEVMRSQLATAHRFISRIPEMLKAQAERDELALKTFELQRRQFATPPLNPAEQERYDADIARLGERETLRLLLEEQHRAKVAGLEDKIRTLIYQHASQVETITKDANQQREQNKVLCGRIDAMDEELEEADRRREYMLSRFKKVVDVLRGFEGPMAEQVRRICVRVLDKSETWTHEVPDDDDDL